MIIITVLKIVRLVLNKIFWLQDKFYTWYILTINGIIYDPTMAIKGRPFISVSKFNGVIVIGKEFWMNNGLRYATVGSPIPCRIVVRNEAVLEIGDRVGMTSVTIYCTLKIRIGNDVKIGGGAQMYDSDFHSISPNIRINRNEDSKHAAQAAINIEDNVFIGSDALVLKGVTIGKNSVIAAKSVVTKNVPPNELWAGNPAKFIRKIY